MSKRRFIAVIDVDTYDGDREDFADYLAMSMMGTIDSPFIDTFVYDDLTDLSLDVLDMEGPFA